MASPADRDLCARCGNQFPIGQACARCTAPAPASGTRLAIFGSVDGLTMFLGLTLGIIIARQSSAAVWHAALGGAMGELVGMTSGQWISDGSSGFGVALACGTAGAAACVIPAVPFAFAPRLPAMAAALGLALTVAALVAWVRPEKGLRAVTQTYGVLIAAGVLSGLTGLA